MRLSALTAALSAALALLMAAPLAAAAPADLDTGFSGDGRLTDQFGSTLVFANDVLVQSSGRIVAGGVSGEDWALAGYDSAGNADPTFGTTAGGHTLTDWEPLASASSSLDALARDATGRIVAVGSARTGSIGSRAEFAVARYSADGIPDSTFDSDGMVRTPFAGGDARAVAVAVQPDGKIVVAGTWVQSGAPPASSAVAVARYNADGSLDTDADGDSVEFGTDGIKTIQIGGNAFSGASGVVLQSDGKIVLGGHVVSNADSRERFALIRLLGADGATDTGFGTGGVTTTTFDTTGNAFATDLTADASGRLLLAGRADSSSGGRRFALARYTAAGVLDGDFTGGGVTTAFGTTDAEASAVEVESSGKIVVVGHASGGSGGEKFAIARYATSGLPDSAFGSSGKELTDLPGTAHDYGLGLAIQPDGKLVVAGAADEAGDFATDVSFGLVRYLGGEPPSSPSTPSGSGGGNTNGGGATTTPGSGSTSQPPAAGTPSPGAPAPSFFEQVFDLHNLKLIPDARFPVVLDYMPYRGARVKRGLYDPQGAVREAFPNSPTTKYWTLTDVREAVESLAKRNVFVRLTPRPVAKAAVPDSRKPYVKPGFVVTQTPLPKHQKAGAFVTSRVNPPELKVVYWDPALDAKPQPPAAVREDGPCKKLQALLGQLPADWDRARQAVIADYAEAPHGKRAKGKGCEVDVKVQEFKSGVNEPQIISAKLGPGGDDAKSLDIMVWQPQRPDLKLTVYPADASSGVQTLDELWQLPAPGPAAREDDAANAGFRVLVGDLSVPVTAHGSVGPPLGNVRIDVRYDPDGGGEDFSLLASGARTSLKETSHGAAGSALVEFSKGATKPGTLWVYAEADVLHGESLKGWTQVRVAAQSKCYLAANGVSWKLNKRGNYDATTACPAGARAAKLENGWSEFLCTLVCWTSPGLRAKLEANEQAVKKVQAAAKPTPAVSPCKTVAAQTSIGGQLRPDPTPGTPVTIPVEFVGPTGNASASSQNGIDLGDDKVALTAVTDCGGGTALDVTKASSTTTASGGNLIGQAGGNLIGQAGGNLIGQAGGNVIATGGGKLIGQAGGNVIATGGGNVISTGGGNVIATGGGN
jgi:uncharacterized delta-60 repeat protein